MKIFNVGIQGTMDYAWREFFHDPDMVNIGYKLSTNAVNDMLESFDKKWITGFALSMFSKFNKLMNIPYHYELNVLGQYFDSQEKVFLANLSYEFAKMSESIMNMGTKISWCTTFAKKTDEGMLHARNLDWPLEGLKENGIILNFESPLGDFKVLTFPGFVGALTGVSKNRFSASVNMLIGSHGINLRGAPLAMIVRRMFETCKNYYEAKEFLMNEKAMCPGFVTLCGPKTSQRCVVAVMSRGDNYFYDYMAGDIMGLTNHFPDDEEFSDDEYDVDSVKRLNAAYNKFTNVVDTKSAMKVLKTKPIYCKERTMQSAVMNVNKGTIFINRKAH